MLELRHIQAVARWCNQEDITIPPFEPEWEHMRTRSSVRCMKAIRSLDGVVVGYRILRSTVRHILQNPMYIGEVYRRGHLVKTEPALAIVDQATFGAVQEILARNLPRLIQKRQPQLLAGLLYCVNHVESRPLAVYHSSRDYRCSYEQGMGLTEKRCFMITNCVLDVPVQEAILTLLSYADRADQIIGQLEQELADGEKQAEACNRERVLDGSRNSLGGHPGRDAQQLLTGDPGSRVGQRRRGSFQAVHHLALRFRAETYRLSASLVSPEEYLVRKRGGRNPGALLHGNP
jgi:hypothetical protein